MFSYDNVITFPFDYILIISSSLSFLIIIYLTKVIAEKYISVCYFSPDLFYIYLEYFCGVFSSDNGKRYFVSAFIFENVFGPNKEVIL